MYLESLSKSTKNFRQDGPYLNRNFGLNAVEHLWVYENRHRGVGGLTLHTSYYVPCMCRVTVWHFKSKYRFGEVFVARHEVFVWNPAIYEIDRSCEGLTTSKKITCALLVYCDATSRTFQLWMLSDTWSRVPLLFEKVVSSLSCSQVTSQL